jgi:hypothetical protein
VTYKPSSWVYQMKLITKGRALVTLRLPHQFYAINIFLHVEISRIRHGRPTA